MRKVLIFVASGFSTRMGGFPKGLALVNGKPVIANAIDCAIPYYDDIYVICNFKTESHFQKVLLENGVKDVNLRPIITGKGDAESVLKSIMIVKNELKQNFDCTFCWGDAFFVSEQPFSCMIDAKLDSVTPILVGCSVDMNPYAYFDVYTENGDFSKAKIKKSYFKKKDGEVPVGIHDQCIFRCNADLFLEALELYKNELGYNGNDYLKSPTNEMGLLHSFTYFDTIGKSAQITLIPEKQVFSFNTVEELNAIVETIDASKNKSGWMVY